MENNDDNVIYRGVFCGVVAGFMIVGFVILLGYAIFQAAIQKFSYYYNPKTPPKGGTPN
jgi:hypothetical protein